MLNDEFKFQKSIGIYNLKYTSMLNEIPDFENSIRNNFNGNLKTDLGGFFTETLAQNLNFTETNPKI